MVPAAIEFIAIICLSTYAPPHPLREGLSARSPPDGTGPRRALGLRRPRPPSDNRFSVLRRGSQDREGRVLFRRTPSCLTLLELWVREPPPSLGAPTRFVETIPRTIPLRVRSPGRACRDRPGGRLILSARAEIGQSHTERHTHLPGGLAIPEAAPDQEGREPSTAVVDGRVDETEARARYHQNDDEVPRTGHPCAGRSAADSTPRSRRSRAPGVPPAGDESARAGELTARATASGSRRAPSQRRVSEGLLRSSEKRKRSSPRPRRR